MTLQSTDVIQSHSMGSMSQCQLTLDWDRTSRQLVFTLNSKRISKWRLNSNLTPNQILKQHHVKSTSKIKNKLHLHFPSVLREHQWSRASRAPVSSVFFVFKWSQLLVRFIHHIIFVQYCIVFVQYCTDIGYHKHSLIYSYFYPSYYSIVFVVIDKWRHGFFRRFFVSQSMARNPVESEVSGRLNAMESKPGSQIHGLDDDDSQI